MQKWSFIIFILITFHSASQNLTICGTVQSIGSKQTIKDATVTVVSEKDSTVVQKTLTDENGFFSIKHDLTDKVILSISITGYESKLFYIQEFSTVIDFHIIELSPKVLQLNEVVINAYRDPVYYKRDTLIYNADSFAVSPNASVEELLKKLPGIQISKEGNIIYQGKIIKELLVDGDDFFGKDATVATRNLDATVVESVQVFEKKDETNLGKNEKLKVINLKLRDDSKKGFFGNISGATDFQKFYEGKAFGNKFTEMDKSAISFLGGNTPNLSNRGDNAFTLNDQQDEDNIGDTQSETYSNNEAQNQGISKILNTGIYYSKKLPKQSKIQFNYSYICNPLRISRIEESQYILNDTNYRTANTIRKNQTLEVHTVNFKWIQPVTKSTNLIVEPLFKSVSNESNNLQETKFITLNDLLSRTTNTINEDKLATSTFKLNTTLNYKLNAGRSCLLNYNGSMEKSKHTSLLISRDTYNSSQEADDSIDQKKLFLGNSWINNLNLLYREPISKNARAEFNYNYYYHVGGQNNSTLKNENGQYILDDSSFNNSFTSKKMISSLTGKLIIETVKNSLEIGACFRYGKIDNINSSQIYIRQSIKDVLPYLDYRYSFSENSNLQFSYHTMSDQPPIYFLQPVINNSNPNQVFIGNPNLLPTFNHYFDLSYDLFNSKNRKSIWAGVNFSLTNNDFATFTLYDSLGRSTEKIINTNGNYNGSVSINRLTPLLSKKLELNTNLTCGYSNNINYINTEKNTSKLFSANAGLSLTLTLPRLVFNVAGQYGYNAPSSTVKALSDKFYFRQNYSSSIQYIFPKGFTFENIINYTINNKLADRFSKQYIIWNASINKILLKHKNLIVSLIGNDILNQNTDIRRSVNNNVVTDVKTNVVTQYFLLKLTYKFNNKLFK